MENRGSKTGEMGKVPSLLSIDFGFSILNPPSSILDLPPSSLAAAQGVAQPGGGLVLLVGDGLFELLTEGRVDAVQLSQRALHLAELLHHAILLHLLA